MNPNDSLNKVLEVFESGNLPDVVARTMLQGSSNVPCNNWSLMNRIIMTMHNTSDARGFRQWEKVKRHVKKGSKAFAILAPIYYKWEKEDKETGQKVKGMSLGGFRGVPVFRYEDTEGQELPEEQRPRLDPDIMPPLYDVAVEFGLSVSYEACNGGFYGLYSNDAKKIVLCTHEQDVFFHELGHAAHYKSQGEHARKTMGQDWKKETVAELISATIARMYGMEKEGCAYQYIKNYATKAGKDVQKACMFVLSDVQKALACIFETKAQLAKAA